MHRRDSGSCRCPGQPSGPPALPPRPRFLQRVLRRIAWSPTAPSRPTFVGVGERRQWFLSPGRSNCEAGDPALCMTAATEPPTKQGTRGWSSAWFDSCQSRRVRAAFLSSIALLGALLPAQQRAPRFVLPDPPFDYTVLIAPAGLPLSSPARNGGDDKDRI